MLISLTRDVYSRLIEFIEKEGGHMLKCVNSVVL